MAVLSGFVNEEELKKIKLRTDCSILEETEDKNTKDWEGYIYVKLDCNWSVMEFLNNFGED